MDQARIDYIKQRMAEMGYTEFRWFPVRITDTAITLEVAAYNEYLFLNAKTVNAGLTIISTDGDVFNEGVDYAGFDFFKYKEFAGKVNIVDTAAVDLEFIKVVPVIGPIERNELN